VLPVRSWTAFSRRDLLAGQLAQHSRTRSVRKTNTWCRSSDKLESMRISDGQH